MEKKIKDIKLESKDNERVNAIKANDCEEGSMSCDPKNPVNEVMQLYEENKFLKQQLGNISRLEIILRTLEIGNWDEQFDQLLREQVKIAFGIKKDEIQEDNHSE